MRPDILPILRCPFCGDRLQVEPGAMLTREGDALQDGILFCQCCAYPVVAGIPVLRAGGTARKAIEWLQQKQPEAALHCLLEVANADEFRQWQRAPAPRTFQAALRLLSPTDEGTYFLHRFSDPTCLVSEAILGALDPKVAGRARALDMGGGAGHLARRIVRLRGLREVVLADLQFWKLWLARQFVAPACVAVCCDANSPLPFARGTFALAFCSDALNYVWHRRLLISEMTRLLDERGILLVTHMHNALCENPSAGMPLTPAGYRNLFEALPARLFPESAVLDAALADHPLDFSRECADADLAAEPSLAALASHQTGIFQRLALPSASPGAPSAGWSVNPLYQLEAAGPPQVWRRHFPSAAYESEFAACKRYLPERFTLSADQVRRMAAGELDETLGALVQRRILLDLPAGYC